MPEPTKTENGTRLGTKQLCIGDMDINTITQQNKIPEIAFWCERCEKCFKEGWCRRYDKNEKIVEFTFICEECIQDEERKFI